MEQRQKQERDHRLLIAFGVATPSRVLFRVLVPVAFLGRFLARNRPPEEIDCKMSSKVLFLAVIMGGPVLVSLLRYLD